MATTPIESLPESAKSDRADGQYYFTNITFQVGPTYTSVSLER